MSLSHAESRSYADINMTPLIDVMLVLLIIFIITIPKGTHAVKIDNPGAPPPARAEPPDVVDVSIDFDGSVAWNRVPVDRATLRQYIDAAAARPTQPEVHIAVDRFARYESVAQTLADLQRRGLKHLGFVDVGS